MVNRCLSLLMLNFLAFVNIANATYFPEQTVIQPTGSNLHSVVDSSALPTGASTSAIQTTQQTTLNSILSAIGTPAQAGGSMVCTQPTGTNLHVVVDALPLPSGASTSAKQDTGNTALATINTTLGSPFQAGGSIGNTAFGVSGTLPAFTSTPTFNIGTLNGAATAANQTTGNTKLDTINTTLGSPMQNSGGTVTATQSLGSNLHVAVDSAPTIAVTVASLPLPSGASTSAKQDTGNASVASIDTKTPSLGQSTAVGSSPVVFASDQTPIADLSVTGSFTASAQDVTLSNLNGSATVTIQISGTFSGAVNYYGSADGTNFIQIFGMPAIGTAVGSTTTPQMLSFPTAGMSKVKATSSAWVSGTANLTMRGSQASFVTYPLSFVQGNLLMQAMQGGTWTVQPGNTANTTPWLSTINDGTHSASVSAANALKVDNSAVTQPVSAASLPLPSGAATAALQSTINTTLGSPFQAGGSIGNITFGVTQGTAANLNATVVTTGGVAVAKDSSLTTINTTLGTPMQASGGTVSITPPVTGSGSAAAATVSTVITLSAPANAIGFVLMNWDTSTANIIWAVGRTATTTLGQQLQPGRDTGFVPIGANVSLVAASGTQTYDIQWIAK